jgi:hypothetical protein
VVDRSLEDGARQRVVIGAQDVSLIFMEVSMARNVKCVAVIEGDFDMYVDVLSDGHEKGTIILSSQRARIADVLERADARSRVRRSRDLLPLEAGTNSTRSARDNHCPIVETSRRRGLFALAGFLHLSH